MPNIYSLTLTQLSKINPYSAEIDFSRQNRDVCSDV